MYQISDIEFITEEVTVEIKGKEITRYLISIALKDTKLPIYTTDYTKYITYSNGKVRCLHNPSKTEVSYITSMLNWIVIQHNNFYSINKIEDITLNMCQDYLNYYAIYGLIDREESPTLHSVKNVRSHITRFMIGMRDSGINLNMRDHWLRKINPKTNGRKNRYSYELDITYDKSNTISKILRDIPTIVIELILTCARMYKPLLELPIAIQIYSGIREGEVCNCRRKSSIYGAGIVFETKGGNIVGITIKLDKEFALRTDNVNIGHIKIFKDALVYPSYITAFLDVYNRHLELTKNFKIEDSQPLFVNERINRSNGCHMAMCVASYRANFKTLMNKHVIPIMRSSDNHVLRDFAQLLDRNRYGLHWYRHYFSIQLVLAGESWNKIMEYRRDKSPESAMVYVTNKKAFFNMYKNANAKFSEEITRYSFITEELNRLEEDDINPIN